MPVVAVRAQRVDGQEPRAEAEPVVIVSAFLPSAAVLVVDALVCEPCCFLVRWARYVLRASWAAAWSWGCVGHIRDSVSLDRAGASVRLFPG
jgi:hypothetical protein